MKRISTIFALLVLTTTPSAASASNEWTFAFTRINLCAKAMATPFTFTLRLPCWNGSL